jgi:hypothetical protein
MNKYIIRSMISLTVILFVLSGCSSDDNGAAPMEPEDIPFTAGVSSGIDVYFSNLLQPDSTMRNFPHITRRPIDINNDFVVDFEITSREDTAGAIHIRYTSITAKDSNMVAVNSDDDGFVRIYSQNDSLESDSWRISDNDYLAYRLELTSDTIETGNWNGIEDKFIAVMVLQQEFYYLGWIEVSIQEYDNYIFYNFASKKFERE